LNEELHRTVAFCAELDKDDAFVRRVNELTDPQKKNVHFYKAAHFFLSDVIAAWEQLEPKANERAMFVLAAYYDALKNGHFADEVAVAGLNGLVADLAFRDKLKAIRNASKLPDPLSVRKFLSLAVEDGQRRKVLFAHYAHFTENAFGLKLKSEQDAHEFFGSKIKSEGRNAPQPDDSLEKVMAELDALIGLEQVKQSVRDLVNVLEV
jgi:stage V sporulation protein K